MLGRDIGSGARGLSCPYFVSETSFFCSSCEPRNCVERVPDFVFGRTWAKDVSGPPHDPTRDSCGVYTPAPRPERRHPLAGHFQRGETASFPGQEFSQTPETRSFHFSWCQEGGGGGGRKNDLFRYSTRFRYRNSNSSPRRIRASRVTDPDSLTARGSRQSCHHPEGIRRDPVTAAGRLRPPRPLSVSIREVVRAEGSPRGKPHERFHPDQERAGGAGAGRRSAPERPAVRREGAKPGLRRSSSTWRKVLFLAWPRAWPAENRSPAG